MTRDGMTRADIRNDNANGCFMGVRNRTLLIYPLLSLTKIFEVDTGVGVMPPRQIFIGVRMLAYLSREPTLTS